MTKLRSGSTKLSIKSQLSLVVFGRDSRNDLALTARHKKVPVKSLVSVSCPKGEGGHFRDREITSMLIGRLLSRKPGFPHVARERERAFGVSALVARASEHGREMEAFRLGEVARLVSGATL